jgi:ankyrin repeat protein
LLAAATYDVELMRLLLEAGADPMLSAKTNLTALMVAAGLGRREDRTAEEEKASFEGVKLTVELGADVNAANDNGQTALHAAAYTGSDAIVDFLVARGADVNVKDKQGQTPLSIAENIVPPTLLNYGLRPFIVHQSTGELLRKLGAVPLSSFSGEIQK